MFKHDAPFTVTLICATFRAAKINFGHIILFLKNKTATPIAGKNSAVCSQSTVSDNRVWKWYEKFNSENFSGR